MLYVYFSDVFESSHLDKVAVSNVNSEGSLVTINVDAGNLVGMYLFWLILLLWKSVDC